MVNSPLNQPLSLLNVWLMPPRSTYLSVTLFWLMIRGVRYRGAVLHPSYSISHHAQPSPKHIKTHSHTAAAPRNFTHKNTGQYLTTRTPGQSSPRKDQTKLTRLQSTPKPMSAPTSYTLVHILSLFQFYKLHVDWLVRLSWTCQKEFFNVFRTLVWSPALWHHLHRSNSTFAIKYPWKRFSYLQETVWFSE